MCETTQKLTNEMPSTIARDRTSRRATYVSMPPAGV
jgi:hypothetical protein